MVRVGERVRVTLRVRVKSEGGSQGVRGTRRLFGGERVGFYCAKREKI